jgi:hypothetical protein
MSLRNSRCLQLKEKVKLKTQFENVKRCLSETTKLNEIKVHTLSLEDKQMIYIQMNNISQIKLVFFICHIH